MHTLREFEGSETGVKEVVVLRHDKCYELLVGQYWAFPLLISLKVKVRCRE